jgi:hypothetical protein
MKHNPKIFNTWAVFHIVFIICTCSFSAYDKYCLFYQLKEVDAFKSGNKKLFFNAPMLYYGRFTGTGAGYGFFAPNIKSGGIILGDCDGNKIGANFNNFESMMRFSVMATRITDYIINKNDTSGIRDRSLKERYYDLVFKSIAVKIYNQNQCLQDTSYLSYNIFDFPTLAAYRAGYRNYRLAKIKEVRLVKQAK